MSTTSGWFEGPGGVPMFATWHLPVSAAAAVPSARGVVVLVGTVGDEQLVAHRALRILADELVAEGLAVVRVDLPGTGDSGDAIPPTEPGDRVPSWRDGVVAAVEHARSSGALSVSVVALRLGTVLVADVLDRLGPLDQLVLWDPWPSGAAYLRRLRALHVMSGFEQFSRDAGVEGPGTWIDAGTAASLKSLRLSTIPAEQPTTLVLRETEQAGASFSADAVAPHADVLVTDEAEQWLDTVRLEARMPRRTTAAIAQHLSKLLPAERSPLVPLTRSDAVVPTPGGPVRERTTALGPRRLFGIVAEPADGRVRGTVLLSDTATTYHAGPARMWVDLARTLVHQGLRVVRYDYLDLGDSPNGTSLDGPRYYNAACVRDAVDAGRAVRGDEPLLLLAHCSGSWASLMAADDLQPDALYLVNPLIWGSHPPEMGPSVSGTAAVEDGTASLQSRARHWVRHNRPVRRGAQAVRNSLVRVGAVGSADGRLLSLVRGGTRVTVTLGTVELEQYHRFLRLGGEQRVAESDGVRVDVTVHHDHALKTRAVRDHLMAHLPTWIAQDLDALDAPALDG
jgi:alpha-beta hydrolase superfamily lysophospholipase